MVRLYNVSLSESDVIAQYKSAAAIFSAAPFDSTIYWGSRDAGPQASSPSIDYAAASAAAPISVNGNFASDRSYRCAWKVPGEESAAYSNATVANSGNLLRCSTPLWPFGPSETLLTIEELLAAKNSWAPIWKRVCLSTSCGLPNATDRFLGEWLWGAWVPSNLSAADAAKFSAVSAAFTVTPDTVRNPLYALLNNVSPLPSIFRFTFAASIFAVHQESPAVKATRVVVNAAGQGYIQGLLVVSTSFSGGGKLFKGSFTVGVSSLGDNTESGGIATASLINPGVGYPPGCSGNGTVIPVYEGSFQPMTGSITRVTIRYPGKGYPNSGGVFNVTGGTESIAAGWFTVNSTGAVTDVRLTSHGAGYLNDPNPSSINIYSAVAPSIPAIFEVQRASGASLSFCAASAPAIQVVGSPGAAAAKSGLWSDPSAHNVLLAESAVTPFSASTKSTRNSSETATAGKDEMFLLVSGRWSGRRITLSTASALLSRPDPSVLYRCTLPSAGITESSAQCKCSQVIDSSPAEAAIERWHSFALQGSNFLAAAVYRDSGPASWAGGDAPSAGWSVIIPMDATQPDSTCSAGEKGGPVQVGDATYIRSTGAAAITTFTMNDTERKTQVVPPKRYK